MLHPTTTATIKIILLYLLSNLGKLTATLDGSVTSLDTINNELDDISPFDLNEIPKKRTYTYVSEYKRLPVYNFGLGKRQNYGDKRIKPFSFGLGKRSRGYIFGLGKKNDALMNLGYPQLNNYDSYYHPDMSNAVEEKRNNKWMYSFGLGKRSLESNNDFANYLSDNFKRGSDKYVFGLGKKSFEDQEFMMS